MDILKTGKRILKTIEDASFEAYFVGGAVRDYLLGYPVQDVDITTSATPDDIETLFPGAIPTGKAFGTMTVLKDGFAYEITTYRVDGVYENHRKPESITFATHVEDDLKRRDFTINQLLMNQTGEIIDTFGGRLDLESKIIRTIGDPKTRFQEDALRLLRAFRFMAKLDFEIEPKTLKAIEENASLIQNVSIERIQSELEKMLGYPTLKPTLSLMIESGFAHALYGVDAGFDALLTLPELKPFERLFMISKGIDFQEKPWKLPKRVIRKMDDFHAIHEAFKSPHPRIFMAYDGTLIYEAARLYEILHNESIIKTLKTIEHNLTLPSPKALAVSGKDLDNIFQFHDKSEIQRVLNTLIDAVLESQIDNKYEALIDYAKKHLERSHS